MKKLLGILVLGLLWCNISFAQDYRIKNFIKWLYENGHNQYVEKDSDGKLQTNLKLKLNPRKRSIDYDSNPNRDTLLYYVWDFTYGLRNSYEVKPSKEPYEFKFNLIDDQLSDSLPAIAKSLIRKTSYLENKVFNDYGSETDFLRYLQKLEDKDLALNKSMIPLG